jgi:hypothetical protein
VGLQLRLRRWLPRRCHRRQLAGSIPRRRSGWAHRVAWARASVFLARRSRGCPAAVPGEGRCPRGKRAGRCTWRRRSGSCRAFAGPGRACRGGGEVQRPTLRFPARAGRGAPEGPLTVNNHQKPHPANRHVGGVVLAPATHGDRLVMRKSACQFLDSRVTTRVAVWVAVHHRAGQSRANPSRTLVQHEPIRTTMTRAALAVRVHALPGSNPRASAGHGPLPNVRGRRSRSSHGQGCSWPHR